ncbi:hypothetical protein [Paenibacillus xerothermodurans]|uniref:Uncharacterized protein n=1 Tax=Paenibacillus xerothermodurans TaxID=1977292 RepID=A0A2W1NT37_PAEXE|nr:hypothetical protein [Paenibacillus xerothermodurans]PZE22675.1 hypothetical protein CBW46_002590 [Paenibacillus xerothermodurans]
MSESSLWLTAVRTDDAEHTVTLLADRFELVPAEAGERFLTLIKSLHPRMLVAFKANLLLSEEAEMVCGVEALPFRLDNGAAIGFGVGGLELSHCAENYFNRLPEAKDMVEWLAAAARKLDHDPQANVERQWLNRMSEWVKSGHYIALLREET